MPGGKKVRPAQHGGDRRFGRSLADMLNAGKTPADDGSDMFNTGPAEYSEELDKWDPEDIQEEESQRRARKNENIGYPENY